MKLQSAMIGVTFMRWMAIVAVLFAGPQVLKAEEAQAPGRYESLKQGAREWLPNLPELSMPSVPSMPSVSMPSMPDFSMPRIMDEFNSFTQQVADSLPILEEMGYEVTSFRVQWALPPKARLRLRSKGTVEGIKLSAIADKATGGVLMSALVSSAATAKRIQSSMKLGTAILDVDFAIPPKVRMSFLKPSGGDKMQVNERDPDEFALACRDVAD